MFPEPFQQIASGITLGAVIGGVTSAVAFYMKKNSASVLNLNVPGAAAVEMDIELKGVLSKFTHLAKHSDRTKALYRNVVLACNAVVAADHNGVKGAAQVKASRCSLQAIASAKILCREAAKVHRDDSAFEAMQEIEVLEKMMSNRMHNIML
jgi:hypothetical protein